MKLSPREVQRRYRSGELKIALLGMSNIGKSYFAQKLEHEFGFKSVEVDRILQEKLGKASMDDHAKWLGQPYSEGYKTREDEAMRLESNAINDAVDICLKMENTVLDAPGSVIYANKNVLKRLTSQFLMIYIEANENDLARLKQLYYTSPKPLIWKDSYDASRAKTPREAVLASYGHLLSKRAVMYQSLADITLPAQPLYDGEIDIKTALAF